MKSFARWSTIVILGRTHRRAQTGHASAFWRMSRPRRAGRFGGFLSSLVNTDNSASGKGAKTEKEIGNMNRRKQRKQSLDDIRSRCFLLFKAFDLLPCSL